MDQLDDDDDQKHSTINHDDDDLNMLKKHLEAQGLTTRLTKHLTVNVSNMRSTTGRV